MRMLNYYRSQEHAVKFLLSPNPSYSSLMDTDTNKEIFKNEFSTHVLKKIDNETTDDVVIKLGASIIYEYGDLYELSARHDDYSDKCFTSIYSLYLLVHNYSFMRYGASAFVPKHDIRTVEGLWNTFIPFIDSSATRACTFINSIYYALKKGDIKSHGIYVPSLEILPYLRIYLYYVSQANDGKVDSDAIINEVLKVMGMHKLGAFQLTDEVYELSFNLKPHEFL